MSRSCTAGDRRRGRILDSAVAAFGGKGFEGTTTRELARAAGVDEATFVRFFPDKAVLYRAVIDRLIASSGDPFPHAAAEARDDGRVLADLAEGLIRDLEQEPAVVRLLLFSALEAHELSRPFLEARILGVTKSLARYLTRRMEEGALRDAPPLPTARAFLGMVCNHALMNTLYGRTLPGRMPRALAAQLCAAVFLDGLQSRSRSARAAADAGRRHAVGSARVLRRVPALRSAPRVVSR